GVLRMEGELQPGERLVGGVAEELAKARKVADPVAAQIPIPQALDGAALQELDALSVRDMRGAAEQPRDVLQRAHEAFLVRRRRSRIVDSSSASMSRLAT